MEAKAGESPTTQRLETEEGLREVLKEMCRETPEAVVEVLLGMMELFQKDLANVARKVLILDVHLVDHKHLATGEAVKPLANPAMPGGVQGASPSRLSQLVSRVRHRETPPVAAEYKVPAGRERRKVPTPKISPKKSVPTSTRGGIRT